MRFASWLGADFTRGAGDGSGLQGGADNLMGAGGAWMLSFPFSDGATVARLRPSGRARCF